MTTKPLHVTTSQILAFRRRIGALDERLPTGDRSLRQAAWAGLQDSMPRAALLSIHARVAAAHPDVWDDPSLVQVWGPRFQLYVVPARDHAVFTLGRLPESGRIRSRADELAERLRVLLGDERMRYDDAGAALGVHGNMLRYAALTGTLAVRWEGARRPLVWIVDPPQITPAEAASELAQRYLHVYGPSTAAAFGKWAGVGGPAAARTFDRLMPELLPVQTPTGAALVLTGDEDAVRAPAAQATGVRLLPSGDAYTLQGTEEARALLVPDAAHRAALWTPRVWPGALLLDGEIVGTWRRSKRSFSVQPWRRLTAGAREAIERAAEALPLPDEGVAVVDWM